MKMISIVACMLLSSAAMANNGNGNGNDDNNGNGGNGGAGGTGVGIGVGVGIGTGVGVANSDSNSKATSNSDSNSYSNSRSSANQRQGQEQGQLQGQQQGQIAEGGNAEGGNARSTSKATGGSSNATGGNSDATGGNATNAGNTQTTNTTYVAQKNPVNTAVAGLGQTTAACRFNDGVGLQLLGTGVSLGHSFKDKDCERIALAQIMWSRGNNEAGDRLMCQVTTVRKALADECYELVHTLRPSK